MDERDHARTLSLLSHNAHIRCAPLGPVRRMERVAGPADLAGGQPAGRAGPRPNAPSPQSRSARAALATVSRYASAGDPPCPHHPAAGRRSAASPQRSVERAAHSRIPGPRRGRPSREDGRSAPSQRGAHNRLPVTGLRPAAGQIPSPPSPQGGRRGGGPGLRAVCSCGRRCRSSRSDRASESGDGALAGWAPLPQTRLGVATPRRFSACHSESGTTTVELEGAVHVPPTGRGGW